MPEMQSTPTSIPPWVHFSSDHSNVPQAATAHLIQPAAPARPNTRHYKPPPQHYRPGRKWDTFRSAEAPLLSAPIADEQVRWVPFMQSGPNPFEYRGESRVMSEEWMLANMPHVMRGWDASDEYDPEAHGKGPVGFKGIMYKGKWLISPERQERTVKFFWRLLLKNAFVPLVFRLTCLSFTAAALGVAATIYEAVRRVNSDNDTINQCMPRASTYMAIIVGSIAIPYVGYVTWDEYMAKPLGLRSVLAKTLLLLCDLYFIVFSASNVSLAFDALEDNSWACYDSHSQNIGGVMVPTSQTCPNNPQICYKQGALSGVLIVLLVSWLLCFSVSVMRVVEKLRVE